MQLLLLLLLLVEDAVVRNQKMVRMDAYEKNRGKNQSRPHSEMEPTLEAPLEARYFRYACLRRGETCRPTNPTGN